MDPAKDYYGALEVNRDESVKSIHNAYRRLAKQYHPDHAGAQGAQRFREVQEAYEILSDPEQRRRYDARAKRARPRPYGAPEPLVRPHSYAHFHRPEPLIPRSSEAAEPFAMPHDIEEFIREFFKRHARTWF
jgi:DnaJ-class molecular chaperone